MTKEESSRWRWAVIISICLHAAFFFIIGSMPEKTEEEKHPAMSVRLVMCSVPQSGGGRAGEAKEKKRAETRQAPKPAQSAVKQTEKKTVKKTEKKVEKKIVKPAVKPTEAVTAEKPQERPAPPQEEQLAAGSSGAPDSAGASEADAGGGKGNGNGKGAGHDAANGIASLGDLEVLKKTAPEYPLFSRKRREEGTVVIIARVTDGSVTEAELESSSGHSRLDESAMRAVMGWKFNSTGTLRVRIPFVFKLR